MSSWQVVLSSSSISSPISSNGLPVCSQSSLASSPKACEGHKDYWSFKNYKFFLYHPCLDKYSEEHNKLLSLFCRDSYKCACDFFSLALFTGTSVLDQEILDKRIPSAVSLRRPAKKQREKNRPVNMNWFTETLSLSWPISSVSQVGVQVEDVNESPQFPDEVYKATVFSIAPYKTSVVRVEVNTPSFCHPLYLRNTN